MKINQNVAIVLMFLCTLFASTAHIFLKFGANKINPAELFTVFNLPLILGMGFFGLGALLMMTAFKFGELSVLLPILSMSYVWVSLLSPLFFAADSMNVWKWIGVVIIIVSVSLLGFGSQHQELRLSEEKLNNNSE